MLNRGLNNCLSLSVSLCLPDLQGCDLPEQSTVHVVLPPPGSGRCSDLALQHRLGRGVDSLTRLDLTASRLPTTSTGLAVILETDDEQRAREEPEHTGVCSHVTIH